MFGINKEKENEEKKPIGKPEIKKALEVLKKYKTAKMSLEQRIVEEEKWWRLRHWEVFSNSVEQQRPKPVSAWMFNSIANKHADAMDNYPEPNVLPREKGDEASAELLSKILPVIIENNNFEKTYSDSWWYKLKHGTTAYGVFWNNRLNGGKGDIDITRIDLLNLFWEPGISDIQASENLFIIQAVNNSLLKSRYPHLTPKDLSGEAFLKENAYDPAQDMSEKSVVIDWYYKKEQEGRCVLHYCKVVGETVLFATENLDEFKDRGLYDHGMYPVVLDNMYPLEGTPAGFGLVSVMKSPQMYIDRLNQVILENSVMSSRVRYFAKEGGGIDENEFLDWSKPIVHVEGSLNEERLRRIEVPTVSGNVLGVLEMKIDELKETSGNRDFSQGSTSSGVTAAAAIAALQEAGNKTSRDVLSASYRAYTHISYLIIELVRQFYDSKRVFRITGKDGEFNYISYVPFDKEDGKSLFDVVIKPQKKSSYSKLSQNELAKEMYKLGFFQPGNSNQALAAIEIMDFDGKAQVKEEIRRIAKGGDYQNQNVAKK